MATHQSLCGPCNRDGEEAVSKMFCTDCKEPLCKHCAKHHRRSLASAKHSIITIQDSIGIAHVLDNIPVTCNKHSHQQLSLFCTNHDAICCPTCVSSEHNKCRKIISVEEASKNVRDGSALEDLKSRMTDSVETLQKLVHHAKETNATIKTKQGEIRKEISYLRKKLDQHLDILENDIDRHLAKTVESEIKNGETKLTEMNIELEQNEKRMQELTSLTTHASDEQIFRSIKHVDAVQYLQEAKIKKAAEASQSITLEFVAEKLVSDILSISQIGNIVVTTHRKSFSLADTKMKQVQDKKLKVSNKHSLKFVRKIPASTIHHESDILRGRYLPDGRLIFVQYNGNETGTRRAIIYDCSKDTADDIMINSCAKDIVALNNIHAFASLCDGNIQKINIANLKADPPIKMGRRCEGITKHGMNLVVCVEGRLMTTDYDGKNKRTIEHPGTASFVESDQNGKLFYTHFESSKLYCINAATEELLFSLECDDFFRPTNIIIDRNEYIYIVGIGKDKVKRLTPNGKFDSDLLSGELQTATGIAINESKSEIMICNETRKSVLFYKLV